MLMLPLGGQYRDLLPADLTPTMSCIIRDVSDQWVVLHSEPVTSKHVPSWLSRTQGSPILY